MLTRLLPILIAFSPQAKEGEAAKKVALKPPVYADAVARQIAQKAITAYNGLKYIGYDVSGDGETHRVWLSGKAMKESGPEFTWVYNGTTLAIHDHRKKRSYSGKVPPGQISVNLAKLKTRMDPTLRMVFRKANPVKRAIVPAANVRVAGELVLNGMKCQIVEIKRNELEAKLLIRPDGLLAQTTTDISHKGEKLLRSQRSFRYFHVGKPIGRETFSISRPAGYRALKLSALPAAPMPKKKAVSSQSSPTSEVG